MKTRGRPRKNPILLKAPKRRPLIENALKEQITSTMHDWARNLGIDVSTLKSRLNQQGIVYGPRITAMQVYKAMVGDKEAAMTKKLLAESAKVERENREADGELFELPAIEKKLWVDLLSPLRLALEQLPEQLSGMCNPESPDVAKGALRNWVEDVKLKLKGSER